MMIILTFYLKIFAENHCASTKHCLLLHVGCPGGEAAWWIVRSDSYACCKHNLYHFCFKLVNVYLVMHVVKTMFIISVSYLWMHVYLSQQMKQVRQDRKYLLFFTVKSFIERCCVYFTTVCTEFWLLRCANIIRSFGDFGSIYCQLMSAILIFCYVVGTWSVRYERRHDIRVFSHLLGGV